MKRTVSKIVAGTFLVFSLSSAAMACEGSNVLFEDDFSTADPSWGAYDGMAIEGGKLTVKPDVYMGYAIENQSSFFTDFDACVDLVQNNQDPTTGYSGLLFWGVDYDNYYTVDVATNGYVRVSRKQSNRWLTPVAWALVNGVNEGTAVNELRLTVKGNQATIYVNGTKFSTFKGQPPQGGGLIGVYASSPKDSQGTYDFDNFKVTDISDAPEPTPPAQAAPEEPAPAPEETAPEMPAAPAKPGPGKPGMPKTPG